MVRDETFDRGRRIAGYELVDYELPSMGERLTKCQYEYVFVSFHVFADPELSTGGGGAAPCSTPGQDRRPAFSRRAICDFLCPLLTKNSMKSQIVRVVDTEISRGSPPPSPG